jgi:sugar phosphate isomerase/epimerase
VKRLARIGYDGVEIPVSSTGFETKRVTKALKSSKIEVAAIFCRDLAKKPSEFNLNSPDARIKRRGIEYVKKCLDIASGLGAQGLIITTGPVDKASDTTRLMQLAEDSLREIVGYASSSEVTILLEQFPKRLIGPTEELKRIIKRINSRKLRALVDTGHLNVMGEDLKSTASSVATILGHVHLNNNDGIEDAHRPISEGTLREEDFKLFLEALVENDYEGYCGFEIIDVPDPDLVARESKEFLSRILAE